MSEVAVAEPALNEELSELIDSKFKEVKEGTIVKGTILEIRPQVVVVDIGYKSEGAILASDLELREHFWCFLKVLTINGIFIFGNN